MSAPTLQNIADEAGVSRATVSRALRNHPAVAKETRERIGEISRRLGYQTDPLISKLMIRLRRGHPRGEHPVLGYITCFPAGSDWRRAEAFVRIYRGVEKRALDLGYRLEEFPLRATGSTKRLARILRTRNIQGLIFAPMPGPDMTLDFPWSDFTLATVGVSLRQPGIPRVRTNHFQAMKLAARKVRERGYRKVGLFLPAQVDDRGDHRWMAAFLLDQHLNGCYDPQALRFARDEEQREAFDQWLADYQPDVVITNNLEFYSWMVENGYRIPQDSGFVSIELSPKDTDITGIDQRLESVGEQAVDLVVNQLNQNEIGLQAEPKTVLLEGIWREGKTAPPVAKNRPARAPV